MTNEELNDRVAIKELVDRVSILGDRKDSTPRCSFFLKMQSQKPFPAGRKL